LEQQPFIRYFSVLCNALFYNSVALKHKLEIDGVRLSYGDKVILSDIYLECSTGSVIGLLGRNGSGKSSLLQILFGTKQNDDCSVRLNNKSIKPAYANNCIAYLPQFNFLPQGLRIQKAFQILGLPIEPFLNDLPELNNRKKSKLRELSGGFYRLVELYLMIKKEGKFVLLDEPFTHIMPLHIEMIKKWIIEEKRLKVLSSATIFIST
jgi:ABC-type multidrug transport system ATPase subunit